MKATTPALLVVAILIAGLLPGCDWGKGPDVDEDIQVFIESEDLPDVQTPSVVFDDAASDVQVFQVSFGPGCDCPSGCIYSRGYGIDVQDRTGWMEVDSVFFCSEDSLDTGRLRYLDIQPGDSTLFTPEFRDRFREATADQSPDGYAPIYEAFLNTLGRSENTPVRTLRSLINLLFEQYLPQTADALISNPVVRSSRSLLERLAELPDQSGYRPVREEANELLNELSGGSS